LSARRCWAPAWLSTRCSGFGDATSKGTLAGLSGLGAFSCRAEATCCGGVRGTGSDKHTFWIWDAEQPCPMPCWIDGSGRPCPTLMPDPSQTWLRSFPHGRPEPSCWQYGVN
jgi:hypothetical protein